MSLSASELAALLAEPALAAPSGVTPNFDNPPNRNGLAWFVTTFCMVISTIAVCLRWYAKAWLARKVGVEEILMLLAYGAYWATAWAAYSLIYTPGYFVHEWNLRYGDLIHPLYLILVYGCSYSAVLPLLKIAILTDWCRIFVPIDRLKSPFWLGSMFIVCIQALWGIACIILLNTQCTPHAAIWEFYLPSTCYDLTKVMLTSASVQVFSDWSMVLLPQRIIWGLQMNWQKKTGLSLVFGVGLIACISASLRLATTVTFAKEADQMYYIAPLLFWACAEMTCAFIILTVPCLPTIIKETGLLHSFRKFFGIKSSKVTSTINSRGYAISNPKASQLDPSRSGTNSVGNYYKIDEEAGLHMSSIDRSESQEHLNTLHGKDGTVQVTRTTHITVTSDSQSAQSARDADHVITPWTR